MSFTQDVKAEISKNFLNDCCKKSQLAGFIKQNASINISSSKVSLIIKTDNPTTAKRIWKLIKDILEVNAELSIIKKDKLRKNNTYVISVRESVKDLLMILGLYGENGLHETVSKEIIEKDCCKRAYLGGCFLAKGSVNSPLKSNYHLEMTIDNLEESKLIVQLLNQYHLNSKITKRRNKEVVYLKSAEKIGDFLRLIGASNSLMTFEDYRIQRDFSNNFTRLDNCELANEVKTLAAARKQLTAINSLLKHNRLQMLDERLVEIAYLRLKHPEASLKELCQEYNDEYGKEITKSGMKHRLSKLILESGIK